MNRCGNCLAAHHQHRARMSAPALCPNGKGVYREGTDEELSAAYDAAFPDGPKPIATFDLTTEEGRSAAKRLLGPDAMRSHFGAGGGGTASFEESLKTVGETPERTPDANPA